MEIDELLKEKREQIIAIAAKHGANNIRIFGSVARGEADEKSDIDLLIDYCSERRSPWFPLRLIRELEALLGRKVDIITEQGLKDVFKQQELIQIWIIYHLQIIGEAARVISQEFKARYPEIPWRDVSDLRNLIIHEYFRVNLDIIWDDVYTRSF
jgi:hypothetical protein